MASLFAAAVVALLWTGLAAAADLTPRGAIDLNEPGALEALQRSNPVHYDKIRRILTGVLDRPDSAVARWMQTNFSARDVEYRPILLTSHPPQRRLSFALDDTRYQAVVTLTNVRREIVPAK